MHAQLFAVFCMPHFCSLSLSFSLPHEIIKKKYLIRNMNIVSFLLFPLFSLSYSRLAYMKCRSYAVISLIANPNFLLSSYPSNRSILMTLGRLKSKIHRIIKSGEFKFIYIQRFILNPMVQLSGGAPLIYTCSNSSGIYQCVRWISVFRIWIAHVGSVFMLYQFESGLFRLFYLLNRIKIMCGWKRRSRQSFTIY